MIRENNKYKINRQKTVLVGVIFDGQTKHQVEEYLNELAFLAETAGAFSEKTFIQKLPTPNPSTFIGRGKLSEIKTYIEEHDIELVIFDDELSPSQLRNIEKELECPILDRTNLILDIFAKRAQSAHAKTQVELAQYQYLLPRLTRMWTHLERQRGGIGFRGPGEREIETDRRIIRDRITKLKEQLKKVDKQKQVQRSNRGKLVRVSLVGYTNAGKSTLLNRLAKTNVFSENKLFATLDTTVRKVVIENLPLLIADTVGFIRKLPHHLIESFKSTLDEVRESDILLHVVDVSHPEFEHQIEVVNQTLNELDAGDKPMCLVFNKIDAYRYTKKDEDDLTPKTKENFTLDDFKRSWMADNENTIFISAKTKENLPELRNLIYQKAKDIHTQRYPYDDLLY